MARFVMLILLVLPVEANTWSMIVQRAARYETTMIEAGKQQGIDPRILWVIGYNETKFVPTLTSNVGALGMMQFMPATASRFGLTDPFDPHKSIHATAKYVRYLNNLFPNRPDLILAGYNAGEVAVQAYLEGRRIVLKNGKVINANAIKTNGVPPYRETQNYVKQGMAVLAQLRLPGVNESVIAKGDEKIEEKTDEPVKRSSVRASIYLYGDSDVVTESQPKKGASILIYR